MIQFKVIYIIIYDKRIYYYEKSSILIIRLHKKFKQIKYLKDNIKVISWQLTKNLLVY